MCKASELFLVNFIVYDPISSAKCNLFQQQDTPVCSVHIIKILTCLSIGTTQYYIMAYQNPHYKDFVPSVGPKRERDAQLCQYDHTPFGVVYLVK